VGKVLNVRIDDETHERIARLARARRRSRSAIVRDFIAEGARRAEPTETAHDAWKDVLGIAKGLSADLSEKTGTKFHRMLEKRPSGRKR
jgi:predicted transcriptional regulator